MHTKLLKWSLIVLPTLALAAASVLLNIDNRRLRARVEGARRGNAQVARLQEENRRVRELLANAQRNEIDATQAMHADVLRARAEVAAMEKRSDEAQAKQLTKSAAEADALATSRDPARGLTRLEHFHDAGQATPSAAAQTLVWAAMKGDGAALARTFTMSNAARAKAEALIAGLPEDARANWTSEKLASMFFTGFFTEVTAAEIGSGEVSDAQHATVNLRVNNGAKDITIPLALQSSENGWQVVVSDRYIDAVKKRLAAEGKR